MIIQNLILYTEISQTFKSADGAVLESMGFLTEIIN